MNNHIQDFKELYLRDLNRLKEELKAYELDDLLWVKRGEINNSAGNLALHLCGNLKHFIGAQLADTGYIRNRPFEFEGKVTREKLLKEIEETLQMIEVSFSMLTKEDLSKKYPLEVFGYEMTNFHFLIHLQGHLNYHLGQINYHRRLITE